MPATPALGAKTKAPGQFGRFQAGTYLDDVLAAAADPKLSGQVTRTLTRATGEFERLHQELQPVSAGLAERMLKIEYQTRRAIIATKPWPPLVKSLVINYVHALSKDKVGALAHIECREERAKLKQAGLKRAELKRSHDVAGAGACVLPGSEA